MNNTIFAVWYICLGWILLQDQDCMKILQGIHLVTESYPKSTWSQVYLRYQTTCSTATSARH